MASSEALTLGQWVTLPLKNTGMSTNRFLTHCCGRIILMYSISKSNRFYAIFLVNRLMPLCSSHAGAADMATTASAGGQ